VSDHGLAVLGRICNLIDAVDEHHEPALLQAVQQAQQVDVARCERLIAHS
jgi:hypothetical protein